MRTFWFLVLAIGLWGCDDESGASTNNGGAPTNNGTNQGSNNTSNNGSNNGIQVPDPCDPNPCLDGRACTIREGSARCGCPAGTHEADGLCVPDFACDVNTCSGFGTCAADSGGLTCACEAGYSGTNCEVCAEGYLRHPQDGTCSDDPCDLLTCSGDQVCVPDGLTAKCACPAGSHDEDGLCVPDASCSPTSCNGRGTCDDSQQIVVCVCDPGFGGLFCTGCDVEAGFHEDGTGGCTQDPCLPNPCTAPNQGLCAADTSTASVTDYVCTCDLGFHDEAGRCVVDETCLPGACNGRGVCDDSQGVVECTCAAGYVGAQCEHCDVSAGYHDDGAGGCTQDPCLPNPCGEPYKSVCVAGQDAFSCACDPGYHADGVGGCTDDPCLPDVCSAQNKACRVVGDVAQCFTPECDDLNPCTSDTVVQGICQHVAKPDGTSCALDVCSVGASCQAGTCANGVARDCNDNNPCTDDSCVVAQGGCVFVGDDTNVPDDSVDCTVDTCANGVASHVANDGRCDDGLWCTGVDLCQPSNPGADGQGCVVSAVPEPPSSLNPCQTYGACDEGTQSFLLQSKPVGSACEDGVLCTSGDVCTANGECVGNLGASCDVPEGPSVCLATHTLGPLDIPVAYPTVDVTLRGQDFNTLNPAPYYDFSIWAVSQATGTWHSLAYYSYNQSAPNRVVKTHRTPPGVYDIYYATSGSDTYFGRTSTGQAIPYGRSILRRDVVIPAGTSSHTFDLRPTEMTVNVTLDGQDLNALSPAPYYDFSIWAVDQSTGAFHSLAYYSYNQSSPNRVSKTARIMPGTYDLWYSASSASDTYFGRTGVNQEIPYGKKILQRGVVIEGDTDSVDVDVQTVETSVNVTFNGQDLNAADPAPYYDFSIWAVDRETGAFHSVAYYSYNQNPPNRVTKTARMLPGTYDLWYSASSASDTYFGRTSANQEIPYGKKILQKGVVISAVENSIDVDVSTVDVSVNVTFKGQDLNTLSPAPYYDFSIWARDRETGAFHNLAYYSYNQNPPNRVSKTARILPGTYDLWYSASSASDTYFGRTSANQEIPYGKSILRENVVISAAQNSVSVDVLPVDITVAVEHADVDLNGTSAPYYDFSIWAVDVRTGAYHSLAYYSYNGSAPNRVVKTARILPGTYDLVYSASSASDRFFGRTSPGQLIPYGKQVLARGVVISPTNTQVSVTVDPTEVSPEIRLEGEDLNVLNPAPYYDFSVWAVSTETGAWHSLMYYSYNATAPNRVAKTSRMMPGTYNLVYATSSDRFFGRTSAGQRIPYGQMLLDQCVEF